VIHSNLLHLYSAVTVRTPSRLARVTLATTSVQNNNWSPIIREVPAPPCTAWDTGYQPPHLLKTTTTTYKYMTTTHPENISSCKISFYIQAAHYPICFLTQQKGQDPLSPRAHTHQPMDYTRQRSQLRHSNPQSTTTTSLPDHSLTYIIILTCKFNIYKRAQDLDI